MKKIDLSKLKHKELPTKDIEIQLSEEKQLITIKPITGRGLTDLGLLKDSSLDRNSKMCLLALMYGLGISQEDAEMFMDADVICADSLAAEIINFTHEYNNEIIAAKENIKKNSKKVKQN